LAFDNTRPKNDDIIADSAILIRDNFDALKDDQLIDAGLLDGATLATADHTHIDNHNHANKVMLDTLVSNGDGSLFLADNGVYQEPPEGIVEEWYDVNAKLAGCVGDGVTNDSAAISAILNAGSNKTIYFPAGTYKVFETVVVSGLKNCRIICHLDAVFTTAAASYIFQFQPSSEFYCGTGTGHLGDKYITLSSFFLAVGDLICFAKDRAYKILKISSSKVYVDRILEDGGSSPVPVYEQLNYCENIEIIGLTSTRDKYIEFNSSVNISITSASSICMNFYKCTQIKVRDSCDCRVRFSYSFGGVVNSVVNSLVQSISSSSISTSSSEAIIIKNCTLAMISEYLVSRIIVKDVIFSGQTGSFLQSNAQSNYIVKHAILSGCSYLAGVQDGPGSITLPKVSYNILIRNNLFYGCFAKGVYGWDQDTTGAIFQCLIAGNVISMSNSSPNDYGIYMDYPALVIVDILIINNIISGATTAIDAPLATIVHNITI